MAAIVVNDRYLKHAAPGTVTGKLSDVAGLFLAPLVLLGIWELGRWMLRIPTWRFTTRALSVAVFTTGTVFALTKTWTPASRASGWINGVAQWPMHALATFIDDGHVGGVRATVVVVDATDLIALLALPGCYMYARSIAVGNGPGDTGSADC